MIKKFENFTTALSKTVPFVKGEYFSLLCDDGDLLIVKITETFDNGYGTITSADVFDINTKAYKRKWKMYRLPSGIYTEVVGNKLEVLYRGTDIRAAKKAIEDYKRNLITKRFDL